MIYDATSSSEQMKQYINEYSDKDYKTYCSIPPSKSSLYFDLSDNTGSFMYSICVTDKFEHRFKLFAGMLGNKLDSLQFTYNGKPISPSDTPLKLGMKNYDVIYYSLQQDGNFYISIFDVNGVKLQVYSLRGFTLLKKPSIGILLKSEFL